MDSSHIFALYIPELSQVSSVYQLRDEAGVRRIAHVLRLSVDEEVIFFDREVHATAHIKKIEKKYIEFVVYNKQPNTVLQPSIALALPILKKEAFEEAIYGATEIGATVLQPLITDKVHREINVQKEYERLRRIIIAAAEQSKNYNFPELREPLTLQNYVTSCDADTKIFADPLGQKASDIIQQLKNAQSITLLVGPEGDLTSEEKSFLKEHNFLLCALTPTILRAQQAAIVGLGILRSCL